MANNKGSSDLYRLIKELSPHEKAYFKKYAGQHTMQSTEYLKLFDAIDHAQRYEDKALRQQFKNFSFLKNYLFRLLLNVLVSYYNNPRHKRMYLMNTFMQAAVLEHKGFTKHAIRELERGEALAAKNNYQLLEYTFASVLYRLQAARVPISEKKNYLEKAYNSLHTMIQRETLQLRYLHEFDKLILLATQKTQGSAAPVTESDIDFSLLETPPISGGAAEKRSYNEAMLAYYLTNGGSEKALALAQEYLKEEKKRLREPDNDFYNYSQALTFCIISSTELRKIPEAEKYLEALHRVKSPNESVNAYNLSRYVAYKLIMYGAARQYAKGASFALQAQEKYPHLYNGKKLTTHYHPLVCYSLFALFMNRNYKECIALLNRVNMVHIRKNALYSYRDLEMLRLMLQAEMGNYGLMGNLIRSASMKLKKYNMEDEYIKTLFHFFKSLPKKITEGQKKTIIAALDKIVAASPQGATPYLFMGIMLYQDWIKQLKIKAE